MGTPSLRPLPASAREGGHADDPAGGAAGRDCRLKVLDDLARGTRNPDGAHTILLQHVLPTTVEYIDRVDSVYPVDLVVAVSYSVDPTAVDLLRARGYRVFIPPSIRFMLNELWEVVREQLGQTDRPVIVQEIGGYLADWTHQLAGPGLRGIVEDTRSGLWRYQAADRRRPLAVPVLSMADTPLKRVEDALIGDACVYSLERVMRCQMGSPLAGCRCGVVGWGNVGKSVAAAFLGRHAVVSVYDIDPTVNMLAYHGGYSPVPLARLLAESAVVMGCSGRRSIRVADLDDLRDGAVLCSASSRDVEFDLPGFAGLCDVEDVTPAGGACPVDRYAVRRNGKSFYVLKHGTPIDFLDVPLQGPILDATCAELFVCLRELASRRYEPGLVELSTEAQVEVARKWLRSHAEAFSGTAAASDKTFRFPESCGWE